VPCVYLVTVTCLLRHGGRAESTFRFRFNDNRTDSLQSSLRNFVWNYRVSQKSLTNFTVKLKVINCREKCETFLFDGYIHSAFFFIHSAHFNVGTLCRTENIHSEFQLFPCANQHASIDCCDDIANPCLQIVNSCNLGSIKLILNITPQKSRGVMSGNRGGQASGPPLA
jgi:hypothetical protein